METPPVQLARLEDAELIGLTPDCPEAFGVFYSRHERTLLAFFMKRTSNPELAADLTAETFAAALLSVRRFDSDRSSGLPWLLGIAQNLLLRAWKRGRVEDRARRRLGMEPLPLEDDHIERISTLRAVSVDELLRHLPAEQSSAVRARIIAEQPYSDIAKRARCSESVVRKRVSRGLATLRAIVKEP